MSELEIKKRELDEKMTAIADEIRELSGDTALKGLDDMAQGAQTANAEIADQEELLAQVSVALENKVSGYENGKNEGFAEALDKRTDLVVTENGEYTPSEESTGFKSVSVSVPNKFAQFAEGRMTEIAADDLRGVTKIGDYMFQTQRQLVSIVIPNTVRVIGLYAFAQASNLSNVLFEEGSQLKTIESNGFYYITSGIESIILPQTLESIGTNAFAYCMRLKSVVLKSSTPPTIQSNTFNNVPSDCVFTIPVGSGEAYRTATNWSAFADRIIEGDV